MLWLRSVLSLARTSSDDGRHFPCSALHGGPYQIPHRHHLPPIRFGMPFDIILLTWAHVDAVVEMRHRLAR
jgi:hypothetical protein